MTISVHIDWFSRNLSGRHLVQRPICILAIVNLEMEAVVVVVDWCLVLPNFSYQSITFPFCLVIFCVNYLEIGGQEGGWSTRQRVAPLVREICFPERSPS